MEPIDFILLPEQKSRKSSLKVKVDLYVYAEELFEELSAIGIIQRLKDVPQLGAFKVPKKLNKSRYDYTMLQLYFHQLVKKELQSKLKLTYNNPVKAKEFHHDLVYPSTQNCPTVGDMLQILTIAYNLGHFYNTFAASRAVVMLAVDNPEFQDLFINSFNDKRFQEAAEKMLNTLNYQRLHLLNSLLVLEHCDQNKQSVILAKELLFAYLNESQLAEKSKLHFVFNVFRSVRNLAYISYDLQIANMPFTIDLCDNDAVLVLFRELMSIYNDQLPANLLINSIRKMLDDTVYHENSNAICNYRISRKITSIINKKNELLSNDYYSDHWLNTESIFNKQHRQPRDFSSDGILKLTFSSEEQELSQKLLIDLERINNSRVGYYDRHSGERTILISIKKRSQSKSHTAFRLLKTTIGYLRQVSSSTEADSRYLLTTKFFLHYLFGERPIVIKGTIHPEICVLCTRGNKSRTLAVETLLKKKHGSKDERHEAEHIQNILRQDIINDTSITIPSSILVYQNDSSGKQLCEFDGMVIHPMRKNGQVIFFEAKNIDNRPSYAGKCLSEKLDKLNFKYPKEAIETIGYDALLKVSINRVL